MQKIGIIYCGIYSQGSSKNASTRRVEHFANAFLSAGLSTQIIVPKYNNLTITQDQCGAQLVLKGLSKKIPIISKLSYWLGCFRLLFNLDIVFLYDVRFDGGFFGLIARILGKKVITQTCDFFSKTESTSLLNKLIFRFSDWLVPNVSHLNVVIGENLKHEIQKNAPKTPVLIVPIMVDLDNFNVTNINLGFYSKHNLTKSDFIIGYTGSFWKIYGVKNVIEAFSLLRKEFDNLKLILAGPTKFSLEHDNVPDIVSHFGVVDDVVCTGWLKTEELIECISICDVMVMPHSDHPFCQYGMPNKIGEYAAMGKAIVSTNVSNIENYFEDGVTALITSSNSVDQLYTALKKLIQDQKLTKQLGINARAVAENNFEYQNATSSLINFILN